MNEYMHGMYEFCITVIYKYYYYDWHHCYIHAI